MRKSDKIFAAIFTILCFSSVSANLLYSPQQVMWNGKNYEFELQLIDKSEVPQQVTLWYRSFGQTNYQPKELFESAGTFLGNVDTKEIKNGQIEYYYEINYASSRQTVPSDSPQDSPLKHSTNTFSNKVAILSPEPFSTVTAENFVIAVSLYEVSGNVNIDDVKIYVDNVDLTAKAYVSKELISLTPSAKSLTSGTHKIKIVYSKNETPVTWEAIVQEKFVAPSTTNIKTSGTGFVELLNNKVGGENQNLSKAGATVNGNVEFFNYSGNLYLTTEGTKREQPRNRYSIGLNAKWLSVDLGDFYPKQNELVLWGTRVRGINGEFKSKFFDLQVAVGDLDSKIKQLTTKITEADTIDQSEIVNYFKEGEERYLSDSDVTFIENGQKIIVPAGSIKITDDGTYARELKSARLAFGYAAGKLGITVLKAKDKLSDLTYKTGNPKDNVVLGADFKLPVWNNKIIFRTNAAFSLLTEDIRNGAVSSKDLEEAGFSDLPIDPKDLEDYLIINTSTTPLNPLGFNSIAWDAGLDVRVFRHSFSAEFKSYGSQYKSLGTNFLRNDYKGLVLSDKFRATKNVFVNVRYENFSDNLNESKEATTTNNRIDLGFNVFLDGNLPQLGFNYGLYTRSNDAASDSIQNKIDDKTNTFTTNVAQPLELRFLGKSTASVTWNFTSRADAVSDAAKSSDNLVTLGLRSNLRDLPLKTSVSYTFKQSNSYQQLQNSLNKVDNTFNSLLATGNYTLIKDKSEIYGGLGFTKAESSGKSVNRTNFNVGSSYYFNQHHSLLGDFYLYILPDNNDSVFKLRYQAYF
ncbi:hypothetical protein IT568_06490 [bacterium]|nr:hypothetical protein [bacterium]